MLQIVHQLKINSVSDDSIGVDELWLQTETNHGDKSTIGMIYSHPKYQKIH